MDPVTVIGSGTMAPGIAAAFGAAGHPVTLWGRDPGRLRAALRQAVSLTEFLEGHGLARMGEKAQIREVADLGEAVGGASLIVEAITEDVAMKAALFRRLDQISEPEALLATNTSGLRVTDLAEGLSGAPRVVAMHFWNPAHLMPIVEVGGGRATDPSAVERAAELARGIGKVAVVIKREVLGFLGTRMQQAVVREAIALLEAGVASAEHIDLAVRTSFGARFPVIGALEAADLSGLDVIEAIHRYLLPDLDRSTAPQAELARRVEAGDLGAKSGQGFYDWSQRDPAAVMRRRDEELVARLASLAEEGLVQLPGRG